MEYDISHILEDWNYYTKSNVRKITGDDGGEKIQLRVSFDSFEGIFQMELDGRPDGSRPHNCEFALDYYEEKLDELFGKNKQK